MVGVCRRVRSLKVRVFSSLGVVFAPYPLTTTIGYTAPYFLSTINNASILIPMPSFIEIEARMAQCEADRIRLQQEEEADLREQERLEKEEEERLAKEAEEARREEVRRQEEAREIVRRRRVQKEAKARAWAEEASSDEVGAVRGTIHIR